MTAVLPDAAEAASLVPSRSSVTWRLSGDVRLLGAAAYALLLQVAHPTVGAGVAEHSDFKADPWGRLMRTLDYLYSMTYGGPALAADTGRRVRDMHRHIKGVKPNGERYHAMEPAAYAWVHATLADGVVRGHRHLGKPMSPWEAEDFWADFRKLGRLVGVRFRDLPETWREFGPYFDGVVEEVLEDNESVQDVLAALTNPAAPPLPFVGPRAWRVASLPAIRSTSLITGGLLPPVLRARIGLEWTRSDERRFRALCRASRAATPLMPASLENVGPRYLRWRREAIARGEVASPARGPGVAQAA